MNKEREFLKKLRYASLLENDLRKELEELLAQPEPEQKPVVWQVIGIAGFMYVYNKPLDQVYLTHTVNALYLAPPKRKPLTSKLISLGNNCHESFIKGVRFAEEMHGIGGGE